ADPTRSVPARVAVRRAECEPLPFDADAFLGVLGVELAADGVTNVFAAPSDTSAASSGADALALLSIEHACDAELAPVLVVDDAATGRRVRRAIALSDVAPPARARTLALAAAELIRASWAELVLPGVPEPEQAVPAAIRDATAARVAAAPIVASRLV